MLAEAKQDPELMNYLPEEKELHLLPRQWIANVIYTRLGEQFKAWGDHHVKERHEKYVQRHNCLIDMDPEIAAAFNQSTMVSSKYCAGLTLYNSDQWEERPHAQGGLEAQTHLSPALQAEGRGATQEGAGRLAGAAEQGAPAEARAPAGPGTGRVRCQGPPRSSLRAGPAQEKRARAVGGLGRREPCLVQAGPGQEEVATAAAGVTSRS